MFKIYMISNLIISKLYIGFFIYKAQDIKWGCKDKSRKDKDDLITLKRKMKRLYKCELKEVSKDG
jgi:hypothetical protein